MTEQYAPGNGFEPEITVFACIYCAYMAIDTAGALRVRYPANIKLVKLPCTGKTNVRYLLEAFEQGADGVMVSGCHPGDCHYTAGNYHARRRFAGFRDMLEFCGFDMRRVIFSWVSAAEGKKWADLVNEAVGTIRQLGPFKEFQKLLT